MDAESKKTTTDNLVPEHRAQVILHRLHLDHAKAAFFGHQDLLVIKRRSAAQVLEQVVNFNGPSVVVLDLSTGGNAPERICKLLRAADGVREIRIVAATSNRAGNVTQRAKKLGLSEVFVWPEGAFAELVRHFSAMPGVRMRRVAERAEIGEDFGGEGDELQGTLLNLSSTGALMEIATGKEVPAEVSLELDIPGTQERTVFVGQVKWHEAMGAKTRIGVQFDQLSDMARKAIAGFVRQLNVLPAGGASRGRAPNQIQGPQQKREKKVRVCREGDSRVDYFGLKGDPSDSPILIPKKPFFVPYQPGDILLLRMASGGQERRMRIVNRFFLDPDRVDSRVCWTLKPAKIQPRGGRPQAEPA